MLRIAVHTKVRLFEDTMALFAEADIKTFYVQTHVAHTIVQLSDRGLVPA